MKCFYHSADLDGHCSGAIVKQKHPECEMIGINYGDDFPWDSIKKDETVYMVDFCLQPFSEMTELFAKTSLVWIDHHESAIKEYEDIGVPMPGLREIGTAACELTWKYFHKERTPRAVFLLGRYDVWDHSNDDVLPFQYGMRMDEDTNPMAKIWTYLFNDEPYVVDETIDKGKTVLEYQSQQNRKIIQARGFDIDFDGLRVIACNQAMTNSQLFDSVWDPDKYDAMLTFSMRPNRQWTISMYSTKPDIDVSVICKARGGGGHKGASGFQCKELPF
jgi:oligoribonuclease NrnB/cAMP/cGMP phosphodiesterase (DHH superfamily)